MNNINTIQIAQITFEGWGIFLTLLAAACSFINCRKNPEGSRVMIRLNLANALLLLSEALAVTFRGHPGTAGFFITRISNTMIFITNITILLLFARYLRYCLKGPRNKAEFGWYKFIRILWLIAIILVLLNIRFHFYFAFDKNNFYFRKEFFWLPAAFGVVGIAVCAGTVIINHRKLGSVKSLTMLFCMFLPLAAMIIQAYYYGIATVNIAITISMFLLFSITLVDNADKRVKYSSTLHELQFRIVMSQIQPHFLYSSLNAIYYLIKKDPDAAQKGVNDFSEYLRLNLDTLKSEAPIPFSKELEHLRVYLDLEKMRFDEDLNIVYDIRTENFKVPALSVQPLVESAVKYGVGNDPERGTVTIMTRETADAFLVIVEDNGIGYDPAKVQFDGRTDIGIANVRKRVRMISGGDLTIEPEKGQGTKATISIPKGGKPPGGSLKRS